MIRLGGAGRIPRWAALGLALVAAMLLAVLPAGAPASTPVISYSAQEIEFVKLLNEYRESNGQDALLVSDVLSDAAKKHSHDMGTYSFFGHITEYSDWFHIGDSCYERVVACGYPENAGTGETIAAGWGDTAYQAFIAWKDSYSHNQTMLSPEWKVVGIGFEKIVGSVWGTYWTADFGGYQDGTAHKAGEPPPPDTVSPAVFITSPTGAKELSGWVDVTVTATDDVGVSRVELYCGNTLVGTDTEKPYAFAWDTTILGSGPYTLEARAYDVAGNVGKYSVLVHVTSVPPVSTTTTTGNSSTTTTTIPTTTTTTTSTTTSTTSTTLPKRMFADVPPTHPFYLQITSLAAAGVVSGYSDGLYHPDSPVTRAQFAKIIVLALERHTAAIDNATDPTFRDVPYTGASYPFDFVEEAADLDIVRGFSDGTFGPSRYVTRLQVALMLVRAGGDDLATAPADYPCPFNDVPSYARKAVTTAWYNHLLSGRTATKFDPYGVATRGHAAKMVYGLLQAIGQ